MATFCNYRGDPLLERSWITLCVFWGSMHCVLRMHPHSISHRGRILWPPYDVWQVCMLALRCCKESYSKVK
ncbi:unnamed protein product [Malus baccata var. baccata]